MTEWPERGGTDAGGETAGNPAPCADGSGESVEAQEQPEVAYPVTAQLPIVSPSAEPASGAEPITGEPTQQPAAPPGTAQFTAQFTTAPLQPGQFVADEPVLAAREEPLLRPRRTRRGAIRIGARTLTGAIGIGIAAAAIAAATWLPLPHFTATPPSTLVTPTAATQQRVCPGPALRFGSAGDTSTTQVSSVGQPTVSAAAGTAPAGESSLRATENRAGVTPKVLTLAAGHATSSAARVLAGSQSESVSFGDLAGFAAAECAETSAATWLVGGATDTGRTTLVTLSNPTAISATVSVSVFTENGTVKAAGSEGIVIPPSSQRILPLAGFAPGVQSPVVLVQSQEGQVVANLQQSIIRTLAPGGVDIIGAAAAPAKRAVIPGVVFAGTDAVTTAGEAPGFADLAPVLRLYVPGSAAAKVSINLLPEDGTAPDEPVSLTAHGGVVTDVPLEVGDGTFTVDISADAPVVAAVRASTVSSSGANDFAWFGAAPELHGTAAVSIAPGPAPTLHLANPTASPAQVSLATDGHTSTVTVPARASVAVPVSSGARYVASGFSLLRISVSYQGDGQLAGFTVSPTAPMASPVQVYR